MAANVVFRQVQRRVAQRQHRQLLATPRNDGARLVNPAQQHRVARAVGTGLGQRFPGIINQRQLDAAQRFAAFERGGEDIGLRGMAAHVQADIGHIKIRHLVVLPKAARRVHHGHVNARLL